MQCNVCGFFSLQASVEGLENPLYKPVLDKLNTRSLSLIHSSTCDNTKRSSSNLNIPSEEQAEGKPAPPELPPDALPPPEGNAEGGTGSTEPQDKEKVKKTKNNKGVKAENNSGTGPEGATPSSGQENVVGQVLNNKGNSFRQQYKRLPANLPLRSTACRLL